MPSVDYESVGCVDISIAHSRPAPDEHAYRATKLKIGKSYFMQVFLTSAPLVAADLLSLISAGILSSICINFFNFDTATNLPFLLSLLALVALVIYLMFGLYPGNGLNPIFELRQTTIATTVVFAAFFAASRAFSGGEIFLIIAWGVSLIFVPIIRSSTRSLASRFQWWGQPVLILGDHNTGVLNYRHLASNPRFGLRPVGIIDDESSFQSDNGTKTSDTSNYVGSAEMISAIARYNRVFWAIVALPERSSFEVHRVIKAHLNHFPHVLFVPNLDGLPSLWSRAFDFGGMRGICMESKLLLPLSRILKRIADFIFILIGGLCSLPLIVVIALLVRLSSRGPIIYGQERMGYKGRRFYAWKFRTMVVDADIVLNQHLSCDLKALGEWKRNHKLKNDPRVTRIGRWLRKTSLDELPQLWNILRGDMSLVGPRPIVEAEIKRYGESFDLYTKVLPGLTGLWQISGRNNTTYAERVRLDGYYVKNWSPWMDLYIMARTVKVVLRGEGAY